MSPSDVRKILIIEDEEVLLDVLAKKLTKYNFKVLKAKDGASGLDIARKDKPDLILLDMLLPKVNGYEVLKTVKDEKIEIPIIIISNPGQPVDIGKALSLGARDYVVKAEIDPEDIVSKVYKQLHLEPKTGKSSNRKMILVAEDDIFLRELCVKKLSQKFNVEEALDGIEAWEKIQKLKPDLILLDVIMPGMEGFEILANTRASQDKKIAKTPVIVLSNLGQEDDRKKGMELGANDYLIKANYTIDEIIIKINKLLPA